MKPLLAARGFIEPEAVPEVEIKTYTREAWLAQQRTRQQQLQQERLEPTDGFGPQVAGAGSEHQPNVRDHTEIQTGHADGASSVPLEMGFASTAAASAAAPIVESDEPAAISGTGQMECVGAGRLAAASGDDGERRNVDAISGGSTATSTSISDEAAVGMDRRAAASAGGDSSDFDDSSNVPVLPLDAAAGVSTDQAQELLALQQQVVDGHLSLSCFLKLAAPLIA